MDVKAVVAFKVNKGIKGLPRHLVEDHGVPRRFTCQFGAEHQLMFKVSQVLCTYIEGLRHHCRFGFPFSYNTPVRLWTLHPKYLDTKGLLALWREALLAQKVLRGQTVGYRNHPQLRRFKAHADPTAAIATYLQFVYQEADSRGYNFSRDKIQVDHQSARMVSTHGQLLYEWEHLKKKLTQRDMSKHEAATAVIEPEAHPMFDIIPGGIESWEAGDNRV